MAEEPENKGFDPLLIVLIGLIVALVLKQCYDYYKQLTKVHHEIYFVMMGDTECCNPNNANITPSKNCKKYCMGKLLINVMNRINWAKSSICIAVYNFSNHRIADAVLRAHRRGVKVRVLTDKTTSDNAENKKQIKRLKDAGIAIRVAGDSDKLMHNKFCLVDGSSAKGVLITGSMNWSYSGISKNCENVTFIKNGRVQHKYRDAFDHMWNKLSAPYYHLTDVV